MRISLHAVLADIGAALAGAGALVAMPQARRSAAEPVRVPVLTGVRSEDLDEEDPRPEVVRAYAPYALIVAIFSAAQIPAVKDFLAKATRTFDWPSLNVANPDGEPVSGNVFSWPIVSTGGTLVLLAGVCTAAVIGVHARVAVKEWAATVHELRFAILTVTFVLALAHIMKLSRQAATIGYFVAAGAGLAFLSPVLGWSVRRSQGRTPRPTRSSAPYRSPRHGSPGSRRSSSRPPTARTVSWGR